MKDYPTFLQAAALIKKRNLKMRFVCVGKGEAKYEKAMCNMATELGLDDVLIWAGRRSDMVAVYNAFDIITSSSSFGEGFPNVIGEAMSCGVPCVVTDVGDSAWMVGEAGLVVSAKDTKALSESWNKMFLLGRPELRQLAAIARQRMANKFCVNVLLDRTEQVLVRSNS